MCSSSISREPNSRPAIETWQRFTRSRPCPICTGGDSDRRGRGERCAGYISKDEQYAFCTREEYAGDLKLNCHTSPATYKHRLHGLCNCGRGEHSSAAEMRPTPTRQPERDEVKSPRRSHQRMRPDQIYLYRNVDGSERFRILRIGDGAGKTFIQQRPDGAGDWLDGLGGLAPVLYRLPELLAADPAQPVYIVEGEKCADELAGCGLVVTTNAGGALKSHNTPGARDYLRGRHVIILPDNDPEKPEKPHESHRGQRHAAEVAADLYGVAASVRVVMLPGLPVKGDVHDWLAAGHTADELQALAEGWPEWTVPMVPMMPHSQDSSRPMQDASSGEGHGACLNCASLLEQLRNEQESRKMAETSLCNLRRERALEDQ